MKVEMSAHGERIRHIATPSGPVAVITPVAQKLLDEGVISGDLNGVLHCADAATLKAAIMAGGGVCDFCSLPGVTHVHPVPDFDMPHGAGKSTDGWAACDDCNALILADKRKALLNRSVEGLAFPKFSKIAIAELHEKFWSGVDQTRKALNAGLAMRHFVNDELPEQLSVKIITDRDKRIEAIMRASGLSRTEVDLLLAGDGDDALRTLPEALVRKLSAWRNSYGHNGMLPSAFGDLLGIPKPAAPHQIPHWQQALDAKFAVLATLKESLAVAQAEHFKDPTDLGNAEALRAVIKTAAARRALRNLGFESDLKLLPLAQAYSFNGETAAAIQEAAQSIPHDAPLSSIETPNTGAGWFWFGEPLKVAASPLASDHTHGLLWAWVQMPVTKYPAGSPVGVVNEALVHGPRPALVFSAYVRDEKGGVEMGRVLPSTRWFWPFHLTFHEMLAYNIRDWRQTYGPGAPMENEPHLMTEAETLAVITELSLFFVMACLWFRQTVPGNPKKKIDPVLTQADGHIERHARKRYQREHKLGDTPTVRVVALRRSVRTEASEAPEDRVAGVRNYQCRWIVKGHARLQACGPGRKDRKLIWIDAYVAGPDDKPVKTKTTVYAVVR